MNNGLFIDLRDFLYREEDTHYLPPRLACYLEKDIHDALDYLEAHLTDTAYTEVLYSIAALCGGCESIRNRAELRVQAGFDLRIQLDIDTAGITASQQGDYCGSPMPYTALRLVGTPFKLAYVNPTLETLGWMMDLSQEVTINTLRFGTYDEWCGSHHEIQRLSPALRVLADIHSTVPGNSRDKAGRFRMLAHVDHDLDPVEAGPQARLHHFLHGKKVTLTGDESHVLPHATIPSVLSTLRMDELVLNPYSFMYNIGGTTSARGLYQPMFVGSYARPDRMGDPQVYLLRHPPQVLSHSNAGDENWFLRYLEIPPLPDYPEWELCEISYAVPHIALKSIE